MKTAEIRQRFIDYFADKGHAKIASSPLVPGNDPTLLFTNAGMVQFKDVFLGQEKVDYDKAVTSQRCVRAGGKHNDLENVGYTARHHTFFEMLGNFSFGDYFKEDAIKFAWEFLTQELGLPAEKLWVTVYEKDQEAEDIWLNQIGVNPKTFSRIGEKDNFWSMGDVGPCGPCSEIFYDHGDQYWGGPPGTPEEDGDRFIEIWNLVFMQFDRNTAGELTPLPKPSIDTGMGLERIAAVMQHVNNNYEIDLFDSLITEICSVINCDDRRHHSVRVIADHIRSCAFMIADGVIPSNEGRGYVLRRIIRRAVRHGYQLGGQTPFFYKLVSALGKEMGKAYPELLDKQTLIEAALEKEERRFAETLEQGLKIFEQKTADLKSEVVPGDLVFLLYDTYGFPIDLTADVARERKLEIDEAGFKQLMEKQRERARQSNQFGGPTEVSVSINEATEFNGYNQLAGAGQVLSLLVDGNEVDTAHKDQDVLVVLDQTPFYAEGGGQVGDQGWIASGETKLKVNDCKKLPSGVFTHVAKIEEGELRVGDSVELQVDSEARFAAAANHSATHLLHAALKQVLGDHVQQKGSLVSPERLRFDFSHEGPVSLEQRGKIESLVNEQVFAQQSVSAKVMGLEEAKSAGAEALFGEKYGAEVRTITMGEFSFELCGGTHVGNTAEIGLFKLISESGVAAGVRRLEAVTRRLAVEWANDQNRLLGELAAQLKSDTDSLPKRIGQLQASIKRLEDDNKELQRALASGGGASDLQDQTQVVGDVHVLTTILPIADKNVLRETIDQFKNKHESGIIVVGAQIDGKVKLSAGVTKSISKQYPAGQLIQYITSLADGRGGGRPDMAEGGIGDPDKLQACLDAVVPWVEERT